MMSASHPPALSSDLGVRRAAAMEIEGVWGVVRSGARGLSSSEATERLRVVGANILHEHRAQPWRVLGRQLKSPILILLFVTAVVSTFLGESANAIIIAVILAVSVGLGFVNEFRAEKAADALHTQVRHRAIVLRDGEAAQVDVADLVPGDVVRLSTGTVVAADMRLLETHNLSCDEAIVTGESLPVSKSAAPIAEGAGVGDLTSCVLMGTVVQSGDATAVVVATGSHTVFGQIARALGTQQPQTEFQRGLAKFSLLLLQVAVVLTTVIFVANVVLQRPLLDSLLFSLAIAVGITPQLLPAVVSASLATGSRAMAKKKVLVKRLVCIEDLGDMDVLVTDKTGTLTQGRVDFTKAISVDADVPEQRVHLWGLLASEADYGSHPAPRVGLNPLDAALWDAERPPAADPAGFARVDLLPFDHERRMTSVLVDSPSEGRMVLSKGSPEEILRACAHVPDGARRVLDHLYSSGARVVAVAWKPAPGLRGLSAADESGLSLAGFLDFVDRPKPDARASLEKLASIGVTVKIATGDSGMVAEKVLADIGLTSGGTLSGADIDAMADDELTSAVAAATIFARVSPEQKARIVRVLRHSGRSVGFMGDGVNDALALHQADIGISVDTAADVAKDAADVLLLDKDLGVLADGVMEGRRIFSNTIKYVLMGTSSNFGNMFSASVASVALPFLPMLPSQILLNNLLYDGGQLAIPGDRVDPEQLAAPSHWNIAYIRRFMFTFGPVSSIFDFATFALMMWGFDATQSQFQSGWFIESIATQTLIIFAIRTRRTPFFRSRPSLGLTLASAAVVAIGIWLPYSPLSGVLGFTPLPAPFFVALVAMVAGYLVVVELVKVRFFAHAARTADTSATPVHRQTYRHRVGRRSARFSAKAQSVSRS